MAPLRVGSFGWVVLWVLLGVGKLYDFFAIYGTFCFEGEGDF